MPILNRLILVLQLILATGVSCRCGLELLLEPTGCNMLVCGDLEEKAEADNCCEDEAPPDEAPADDCCPDDPVEHSGDDCLCCTTDFELALLDQDDVLPAASDPVIFDALISADWQGANWMADVLPVRAGIQWGVGPPVPPALPDTLLKQRTLLQI